MFTSAPTALASPATSNLWFLPTVWPPQILISSSFCQAEVLRREQGLSGERLVAKKTQLCYSKHVRNEVQWSVPPTPHRISSELQPAQGIDLGLQSWKVVLRVDNSFLEGLKPLSNLCALHYSSTFDFFLALFTSQSHTT